MAVITCSGVSRAGDVRLPAHMYFVLVVALKGLNVKLDVELRLLCTVVMKTPSPEVTGW